MLLDAHLPIQTTPAKRNKNEHVDPQTGIVTKIPKFSGRLVRLNADNAGGLYNLGVFQLQEKNYLRALELFQKSYKLEKSKETLLNMATCYKFLDNIPKAKLLLEECIASYPNFSFPYNNLGLIHYDFCNIDESIKMYRKALELQPDYADAHWNLALSEYLRFFDNANHGSFNFDTYYDAMDHFNWRFRKTSPVKLAIHHGEVWTGQILKPGERIMIICEQGIGDMIQFMRYAYQFTPAQVVLHLPKYLWPMVREGYECTDSSLTPVTKYFIPLMSMSRFFKMNGLPYVKWDKSVPLAGDFRIGIVWKGSRSHANDIHRSRHYKDFYWLFKHGTVYSLQKDQIARAADIHPLKIDTWSDTMTFINSVDIVVSVDTSVVHLCGAMGRPCIVLIPSRGIDWRWGELGERTIWYDSLRLARKQSMAEAERLLLAYKAGEWK